MNPAYPIVAERAGHRCEYCLAPEVMFNVEFEVEHIVPSSRGGGDDMSNYALACRACNLKKGAAINGIDELTGTTSSLFHPREDTWSDHFQAASDGEIIGLSPVGRVTVRQLNLNSRLQLAARKQWIKLGLFP